jgi:hypothetical protein
MCKQGLEPAFTGACVEHSLPRRNFGSDGADELFNRGFERI